MTLFVSSVHVLLPALSGAPMKKKASRQSRRPIGPDDIRPEYDFRNGIRNKYAARLKPGGMLVVLDPDVAEAFGDAKSVNRALRMLLDVMPRRRAGRSRRRTA